MGLKFPQDPKPLLSSAKTVLGLWLDRVAVRVKGSGSKWGKKLVDNIEAGAICVDVVIESDLR